MKLTQQERTVATVAQKLAGFLVIKMHNALAEGDTKLAEEIGVELLTAGVTMKAMPDGSTVFRIKDTPFHGCVIPPHLQNLQETTKGEPDGQAGKDTGD